MASISRKYGKERVMFRGGPFSGATFPLSGAKTIGYKECRTLTFFARGMLGHYTSDGKWHPEYVQGTPLDNDNIVIGFTD